MTTTTIASLPGREQLTREAGGWITCRVLQPEMEADAPILLSSSAKGRPGNLRFAIDGRQAYLLGELRDADGLLTLADAHARMFAADNDPADEVSAVDVTCVLGETGYEWSQPQDNPDQWQAVANDPRGYRCELTATVIPNGVEVRGRLAAWEGDLAETSESAFIRFLAAAHGRVRCARFTWQKRNLSAVSFAAANRLDVELPDSVAAVVAACRLVCREVRALADAAVAQAYLETMT